jgi:hypothetical protein
MWIGRGRVKKRASAGTDDRLDAEARSRRTGNGQGRREVAGLRDAG